MVCRLTLRSCYFNSVIAFELTLVFNVSVLLTFEFLCVGWLESPLLVNNSYTPLTKRFSY